MLGLVICVGGLWLVSLSDISHCTSSKLFSQSQSSDDNAATPTTQMIKPSINLLPTIQLAFPSSDSRLPAHCIAKYISVVLRIHAFDWNPLLFDRERGDGLYHAEQAFHFAVHFVANSKLRRLNT